MDNFETVWLKKEVKDDVPNEPGSVSVGVAVMDNFETVWIKKEITEEVPNEPGSVILDDPFGLSYSTDIIGQEPEIILEVDETENIVVTSARYETDSKRLIKNGESCGVSFEEPFNQGVGPEELDKMTEKSAYASICSTRVKGLMEDSSTLCTRLKCSSGEKEVHRFSCSSCLKSFRSKYRLIMHVFNHIHAVQPPTYVCKSCGEVFSNKYRLAKHLKMSEGKTDLLPSNHKKFDGSDDSKNILEGDVLVTKVTGKHSSPQKSREISKKSSDMQNMHTDAHDEDKKYRHDNYRSLSPTGNANSQAVQHDPMRPHICNVCGKSFMKLNHLNSHVLQHTGIKPHKCGVCGKSFTQKGNLNRHAISHTAHDEDKKNRHDNYRSLSPTGNANSQAAQLDPMRPHICDVCGKSFMRLNHLNSHVLQHTGIKPHKCDVCGKSFTQMGTLNRHAISHTGKRAHQCDICGKYFIQSTHLKNHSYIHTGIRPHKCDTCGKCFTEPVTLRRHVLIHTGMRPHKCDFCGKSFTLLGDRNRHTLIHTGIKPHKCQICGKSFTQLGHLKGHILNHGRKRMH